MPPLGLHERNCYPGFLSSGIGDADPPLSRIPPAWVALADIIERITSQRYHYPIGRVSRQKIAYFATKAGLPTGLVFEQRSHGPYAEQSKRMLTKLINNGLIDERKRGSMFVTTPGLTLEDAKVEFATELAQWESVIERVADLFLRLPTTRQAELASSVHYIAELLNERERIRGNITTVSEIVERVKRWKKRRSSPFRDQEILGAIQTLAFLGWIENTLLPEAAELGSVISV